MLSIAWIRGADSRWTLLIIHDSPSSSAPNGHHLSVHTQASSLLESLVQSKRNFDLDVLEIENNPQM